MAETLVADHHDARYAIYFSPAEDSPLYRFGSACLGRDVVTNAELPSPTVDVLTPAQWRHVTAAPRTYGFHATLKAPFHLAAGRTVDELMDGLDRFASRFDAFQTAPLKVARISSFVALVLRDNSPLLSALAAACVRGFDSFRAPPSELELARRRKAPLTGRQLELLASWGYPYVLEEWRFHMTLASGLDRLETAELCSALEDLAAPHCATPLAVDAVCLFTQPGTSRPFQLVRRFPFKGRRA
jgi:putative phosphonate metabolism protein